MCFPKIYRVTSNTLHVGPGSTFVAIDGFVHKGTDFIQEAVEFGAKKIVVVPDSRRVLAELSSEAYGYPSKKLTIVGVTGTKGKTTTVCLVEHILRTQGYKTALLGSIKNSILGMELPAALTTPESDYLHTFFHVCLQRGVTHVVMEVSSHAIALQRVYGITFDVVGFTNLAVEHMDFHPTLEDYFATKAKLFDQVASHGSIVINGDDEWGRRAMHKASVDPSVDVVGMNDFIIERDTIDGLRLFIGFHHYLVPKLFGTFNAYNSAMAIIIAKHLGLSCSSIASGLKTFPGVAGRLQPYVLKNGALAFIDYAHNPSSMDAVLKVIRSLTDHLIVIFGCGGDRDKTKRPVMGKIAVAYGDEVIITDDNPRNEDPDKILSEIYCGIPDNKKSCVKMIKCRRKAIKQAVELSRKKTIIALLGKGHESYYLSDGKRFRFDDYKEISRY
jgi:UDP-N-acetylmuramyl-tripeptide synthetase